MKETRRCSATELIFFGGILANMKVPGSQLKRFKNLFLVAQIVLVLPHSNAEEERLFSIVRKNRCDSRFSLQIEGSLSGILAMKTMYPESDIACPKWKPSDELLQKSKRATSDYNKKHSSS